MLHLPTLLAFIRSFGKERGGGCKANVFPKTPAQTSAGLTTNNNPEGAMKGFSAGKFRRF
jgi:hypothetical protein